MKKSREKLIGLLDCNNFFVSCERVFRPDLKNQPVVVLSSNDGCIVARSQEVKDRGIPMGVPHFKVKDNLKDMNAKTFSSHISLYRDMSRRVFEVMNEEIDVVEQYSIDEAFFMIDSDQDPEIVTELLKDKIEKSIGIPVSIGVSNSKTKAKYAATVAKKTDGVFILSDDAWCELSEKIPLSTIWGVGASSEMKYKESGIVTVSDLLDADESRVEKLFGIAGTRLKNELALLPLSFQSSSAPQKSIMSSRSFKKTTMDYNVLSDSLAYHVRHVMADLRKLQMKTSTIRVSLNTSRYGDFFLYGGSSEVFFDSPVNNTIFVLKEVQKTLKNMFEINVPYQKISVTISNFSPEDIVQNSLFSAPTDPTKDRLMEVIDSLNKKSDREVVLIGSRLNDVKWQACSGSKSPAYTTKWNQIAIVKA